MSDSEKAAAEGHAAFKERVPSSEEEFAGLYDPDAGLSPEQKLANVR